MLLDAVTYYCVVGSMRYYTRVVFFRVLVFVRVMRERMSNENWLRVLEKYRGGCCAVSCGCLSVLRNLMLLLTFPLLAAQAIV